MWLPGASAALFSLLCGHKRFLFILFSAIVRFISNRAGQIERSALLYFLFMIERSYKSADGGSHEG